MTRRRVMRIMCGVSSLLRAGSYPRRRLGALAIAVALLLSGCGASRSLVLTSNISVNGVEYHGGPATSYRIFDSDVKPIGQADDINAEVNGQTAYQLHGVDASEVVVMPSRDTSEAAYWIFFRGGALPSPAVSIDWSFPTIPGLCGYLVDRPSNCR